MPGGLCEREVSGTHATSHIRQSEVPAPLNFDPTIEQNLGYRNTFEVRSLRFEIPAKLTCEPHEILTEKQRRIYSRLRSSDTNVLFKVQAIASACPLRLHRP